MAALHCKQLEPLLIKVSDAKLMLGIGNTKFYQLVAAGEIAAVKSGRRLFVEYSTLKNYVAKLREATRPPSKADPETTVDQMTWDQMPAELRVNRHLHGEVGAVIRRRIGEAVRRHEAETESGGEA
jgi:excisionase family DNA binding protein